MGFRPTKRCSDAEIEDLIDQIGSMSVAGLRSFWEARWERAPTCRSVWMYRRITAWRLQSEHHGGFDHWTALQLQKRSMPRGASGFGCEGLESRRDPVAPSRSPCSMSAGFRTEEWLSTGACPIGLHCCIKRELCRRVRRDLRAGHAGSAWRRVHLETNERRWVRNPPSPELWRVRFRVLVSSRAVDAHKQTQLMSEMGGLLPSRSARYSVSSLFAVDPDRSAPEVRARRRPTCRNRARTRDCTWRQDRPEGARHRSRRGPVQASRSPWIRSGRRWRRWFSHGSGR